MLTFVNIIICNRIEKVISQFMNSCTRYRYDSDNYNSYLIYENGSRFVELIRIIMSTLWEVR